MFVERGVGTSEAADWLSQATRRLAGRFGRQRKQGYENVQRVYEAVSVGLRLEWGSCRDEGGRAGWYLCKSSYSLYTFLCTLFGIIVHYIIHLP